jgi:hypothetical protein
MTARFEAFKAALDALCREHDMHIWPSNDGEVCGVSDRYEEPELYDGTKPDPPTPEEIAAEQARRAEAEARWSENHRAVMKMRAELEIDPSEHGPAYIKWTTFVEQDAIAQRKKQMRVSTDPNDPAYIDARPRKVWVNEQLIEGWTVADEFRRVVITPEKVHHGAVLIERLPDAPVPIEQLPRVQQESRPAKRRR